MIYLDNNATTPVDPEVSDAVFYSLRRDTGNPSSIHICGKKTREVVETSRSIIANFLGCSHDEIFFTSGGTESNNLALIGTAKHYKKGHIITSAIEHPSVTRVCDYLLSIGFDVTFVNSDSHGRVIVEEIKKAIRKDTFIISIMHANNETGVLQPVEQIGKLAREHAIKFHVDAAQTIGKIHFSLKDSMIDMLTVAPHKFYGPKGIGCLYIRKGLKISPILYGAGHESGLRPGTENVAGIAGFAKACAIAERDMKLRITHTRDLRDMLFNILKADLPDVKINGTYSERLPNTLNLCIPGIRSAELVEFLKDRVAFSTGSACHAGKESPSKVLKNMGLSDEDALSSIRLSVGKDNTEEEIKKAAEMISETVKVLKSRSNL